MEQTPFWYKLIGVQYLFADIDAAGKPPSGVSAGNVAWLGSYKVCQAIPDAHYCLTSINVEVNKSESQSNAPLKGPVTRGNK